jgi:uncharacterized membrane protein
MSDSQGEKTLDRFLSIAVHLSAILTSSLLSIVFPLIVMFVSDDEVTKENAAESVNFQINLIIWGLISVVLCAVGIGFVMLFVLVFWSIIAPIVAAIKVAKNPDVPHKYGMLLCRLF